MKIEYKSVFIGTLILSLLSSSVMAKPIAATLTIGKNKQDFPGYVTKADDNNIYISQFENGVNAAGYSLASVSEISWREPDDWKAAMDLWNSNNYKEGSVAFQKAMEDYKGIANSKHPIMKDNIGAQAVFYYMECLRRTGQFNSMMEPYIRVQKVNLGSKWQDQIRLFQGWAHLAGKKWNPLRLMMEAYEIKEDDIQGVGDYTIAPNELPLKNGINVHHMAQIFFLRAKSTDELANGLDEELQSIEISDETMEERNELAGKIGVMRSKALTDYNRSTTINYGQDRGLALRSMMSSLYLIKKLPSFSENFTMQKEAHGMAKLLSGLSPTVFPSDLNDLLEEPVDPNQGK